MALRSNNYVAIIIERKQQGMINAMLKKIMLKWEDGIQLCI